MRVESCRLRIAVSAVALAVLACSSACFAQAPTGAPGETNPPGWKPHAANPFAPGHLTPEQEMQLRKGGRPRAAPDLRFPPNLVTPASPEDIRRSEEYTREHGYITVVPPHPAKHWGTANGQPPSEYHRTAPPTPSSGG
jgi:hypothetical protein